MDLGICNKWIDLGGMMLSEISYRNANIIMISLMWNLRNKANEQRKKRQPKQKKQANDCQRRDEWRGG